MKRRRRGGSEGKGDHRGEIAQVEEKMEHEESEEEEEA
jgi:hypothetical protein